MKRMASFLLAMVLLISLVPLASAQETVTVLFTHDMHSHLERFPRLKTLIDREGDALLLDAGDFSMGTLYQAVYATDAAELTLMAHLGYDATTIGNHEFDYRGIGMADMLDAALRNAQTEQVQLPNLLVSNIDWSTVSTEDGEAFQAAMERYGAKKNVILEHNGIKVGVFGLMGQDSQACAPLAPVGFADIVEAAKAQVLDLKAQGAEMIIALSHSGVWSDSETSEDELLAKALPEIDLIISGHTHSKLGQPIVHGSTYIASCDEYAQYLGKIVLVRSGERWAVQDYQLISTEDVPADPALEAKLIEYRDRVSANYLSKFGYTFDQVLCQNPGNLQSERFLLADAVTEAVKAVEGELYEPVIAIVPSGVIRGTLPVGDITTSDAFDVLSLGIGPDRVPGYPLVSVYLTGHELYDLAEVDASVSQLMGGTDLYVSGGGWELKPDRLLLSRTYDVWVYDENGQKVPVEEDKLYRVVADLYSGQMLGAVKAKSFGLLSLEPKDAEGNIITDFEQHIIRKADGSELKAWAALADYLSQHGISELYTQASDRIVESEVNGIGEYFAHAGRIWYLIAGAAAALVLFIVLIILLVRCILRRIKRK